jgi:hypothetical protein
MSLFSKPSVAILDNLTGAVTFLSALIVLATLAVAV